MRFFILLFLTIFVVSLFADDVVTPAVVSEDAIASHPIRVLMVAGRGEGGGGSGGKSKQDKKNGPPRELFFSNLVFGK